MTEELVRVPSGLERRDLLRRTWTSEHEPVRMVVRRSEPGFAYLETDHREYIRANPREGEHCDAYPYESDPDLMLCRFADTPENEPGELFHIQNLADKLTNQTGLL